MEEVKLETGQEEVRDEGAWVGGSAESDELEATTHKNPHPHPRKPQEKMKGLQETSRRCETRYERWSGDMPREWKIWRLVQKKIELFVMAMKELTSQIRK